MAAASCTCSDFAVPPLLRLLPSFFQRKQPEDASPVVRELTPEELERIGIDMPLPLDHAARPLSRDDKGRVGGGVPHHAYNFMAGFCAVR